MADFEIPLGIWLNAGLLVVAAIYVWIRLSATKRRQRVAMPHRRAALP